MRKASRISVEKVLELKLNQVCQNHSILSNIVNLCSSTAEPVLMYHCDGNETTIYKSIIVAIHPFYYQLLHPVFLLPLTETMVLLYLDINIFKVFLKAEMHKKGAKYSCFH